MPNSLINYSNGQTQITRVIQQLKESKKVLIPFRKDKLADVLATVDVFGDVIAEAISWSVDSDKFLVIDPNNVTNDIVTKLSGSKVEISERGSGKVLTGTLAGKNLYTIATASGDVTGYLISIYDEAGQLLSIRDVDIGGIKFLDEIAKTEIKNALARNYLAIKPDSTYIEFNLTPVDGKETDVVIQYTIPTSAWQPVYKLWLGKDKLNLEATAKIDNPTDESWDDFIVSVVVGDPITFETCLAEVHKPKRQKVHISNDAAMESVQVDDSYEMDSVSSSSMGGAKILRSFAVAGRSKAVQAVAKSQDVGDYAIYTTKNPVSIGSNRSALVPLFNKEIEGNIVLFYRQNQDPKRPYRAVKIKNTTTDSLGSGYITVYQEGNYAGQATLEGTKPGEERLLPFARENGVSITVDPVNAGGEDNKRRSRIEINKGIAVTEIVNVHNTIYRVKNFKKEAFRLEIEHENRLFKATVKAYGNSGEIEGVTNGVRVPLELSAEKTVDLQIEETQVLTQNVTLVVGDCYKWLKLNILEVEGMADRLVKSKSFKIFVTANEIMQKASEELAEKKNEVKVLENEQNRLLGLVQHTTSGSQVDEWRVSLAENEKAIKKATREEIPALSKKLQEAEMVMHKAIQSLNFVWEE